MYRIGQSIDIHQLVANRKLILGGVEIDFEYGLLISHIAPKASENSTTLTQIYIWPIDKLILSLLTK